jgi:hypothetical protein
VSGVASRVDPPRANAVCSDDEPDLHAFGTVDLVSGIVEDARDLVGAHLETLRDDMSGRLATLGATLSSMLIAIVIFVVTAVMLGLAIASSLVAVGAPWWLALWAVALGAAAIGIGFVFRTRAKARAAAQSVAAATARVRTDVVWIGEQTVDVPEVRRVRAGLAVHPITEETS